LAGAEAGKIGGRALRLSALALSTLFVLCGAAAVAFAYQSALAPDFVSYWAAAHLALNGDAASAYDIARHHAVEAQAAPNAGVLPFAYPPPFLLFLLPLGVLPFWVAFGAWVAITAGLYVAAARRIVDVRFALAQAAAAANFVIGQNGFLTAAIFIWGGELLLSRPLLGGLVLGLLSVKPQLAILIPVALLAGREWRAVLGALLSASALLAVSLLMFGSGVYTGFLHMLGVSAQWLSSSRWPWSELASVFALLRLFGVPQAPALVIHGIVALGATALTARAWALKLEQRVPILAAAALLVPPYLFTYDGLLLTVPLAWALRHQRNGTAVAMWLLSLLPVAGYFTDFPNSLPIAAMLALWMLHRRQGQPHQV